MSQRRSCDRQLTVCSPIWLGLVTNKELAEEVAHVGALGSFQRFWKRVTY